MSYQIAFGFGSQVFAGIQVFYVDPLVMAVPAIERYNIITIPIHRTVQKDRPLAFIATSLNFMNVLMLIHFPAWVIKEQAVFLLRPTNYLFLKLDYNQ